jgi:hypothetical protein
VSLLRRVVTAALGLVLLQGNLAAAMLPCATGHAMSGAENTSSGGIDSASEPVIAHAAMGHEVATASASTTTERDHPCDHQAHSENCASMASCVAVGVPEAPTGRNERRPAVDLAIVTTTDVPLSRTLLPEVPPPRV